MTIVLNCSSACSLRKGNSDLQTENFNRHNVNPLTTTMISQLCSCASWVDQTLVAPEAAMHTASDPNELKLNKLYKSTKLSNKSTESGLLDKHDRTSPSNALSATGCRLVDELVGRADPIANSIKNLAMSVEGGSNKSNHRACWVSDSINRSIYSSVCSSTSRSINGAVSGSNSSTGPNYCANDKNENKSDDKPGRATDPGRRMTNEPSDSGIKSHHTLNNSPEFASRNAYNRSASSSLTGCSLTSDRPTTKSTGYSDSTCYSPANYSSSDHRSTDNRSADSLSTDRLAMKSENCFNPLTSLPAGHNLPSWSAQTGLNKPMDLLARHLTVKRQFSSFSLVLLAIQLLICGPTSVAAGRHFLSFSIILSPKWSFQSTCPLDMSNLDMSVLIELLV